MPWYPHSLILVGYWYLVGLFGWTLKGRITIPLEVRRLGLEEGSRLRIVVEEDSKTIVLESLESSVVERYYGVFRVRR